jgi:hypothetical protein
LQTSKIRFLCKSSFLAVEKPVLPHVAGAIMTITIIMAKGTPNSKVSHFIPPPCRKPTKAGAETKLILNFSIKTLKY